jgi:hypothetical protein
MSTSDQSCIRFDANKIKAIDRYLIKLHIELPGWKAKTVNSGFRFTFDYKYSLKSWGYLLKTKRIDKVTFLKKVLRYSLHRMLLQILTIPLLEDLLTLYINSQLFFQKLRGIAEFEFRTGDLLIFPSNGTSVVEFMFVKMAEHRTVKIFPLIDNWDNVSSKSIINFPVDRISVWGDQAGQVLKDLHKIEDRKIAFLGTPRFDCYFFENPAKVELLKKPYILYLGTSLATDENKILTILDEFCKHGDHKVVYRPHPWREEKLILESIKFANVELDAQFTGIDAVSNEQLSFQPDLQYYKHLILNADIVVSGLTSMILEVSFFNKKTIGLANIETGNPCSPHLILQQLPHLHVLKNFDNVRLCTHEHDIAEILRCMVIASTGQKSESLQRQLDRVYKTPTVRYQDRLLKEVSKLL